MVVDIVGPRVGVPQVDDLAADLTEEFGREMSAKVRLAVEMIYTSDTTPTTTVPEGAG